MQSCDVHKSLGHYMLHASLRPAAMQKQFECQDGVDASALLCQPTYRLGHPENYLFLIIKNIYCWDQSTSQILSDTIYMRVYEPAGHYHTHNCIFEVFGFSRPHACMYCGSDSCIKYILLMRIFRNRSQGKKNRVHVSIAHLLPRFFHGKKESPSFLNGYLARISSKSRSERTSSKPTVFHIRIVYPFLYSGSQEASIAKQLPGSLEDLGTL